MSKRGHIDTCAHHLFYIRIREDHRLYLRRAGPGNPQLRYTSRSPRKALEDRPSEAIWTRKRAPPAGRTCVKTVPLPSHYRHRRERQALACVVGWAVSAMNDRHLTLKALKMALKWRCADAGLLHHSDEGSTDASEDYQRMLEAHGITCSMSRRGNCYDDAVMEAFFSSLNSELADHFDSSGEAKMELFDCIELFYITRDAAFDAGPDQSGRIRKTRGTARGSREKLPTTQFSSRLHLLEKRSERTAINLRQPSTESDQAHRSATRIVMSSL